MYTQNIDVRVHVNGRSVREYQHNGLTLIEARNGSNYTIKIKNNGGKRVMAVVSVDGIDVITGKPADKADVGYIIEGYSSTEIKGYRVSDDISASFVFVSKGESYSTEMTGTSKNSGVIGVRVFEEKPKPVVKFDNTQWVNTVIPQSTPQNPWYPGPTKVPVYPNYTYGSSGTSTSARTLRSMSSSPSPMDMGVYCCSVGSSADADIKATSLSANFDSGTGFGQSIDDRVKKTSFDTGDKIAEMVLYYATKDALISMGVDLSETPYIGYKSPDLPKAFGEGNYCQPPKGWRYTE